MAEEQRIAKERAAEQERERQKKAEEERLRREAVKRAAAEEAARKEAERKKRQQEEREREEEAKRKRQEAQDKARREKEAREKEAKEKERKEKEDKAAKDKAEKERIAKEKAEKDRGAKEKAEKDRLAKLRDEEEKAKKEEAARKERAAAEQARQAAAQREREAKEQFAAAERAAQQEKAAAAAAAKHAQEKVRTTHPIPVRPGSSSHPSQPLPPPIPMNQPSPIKVNATASTSMHRGQSGPLLSAANQKPMAPTFMSQPIPGMQYASGSRAPSLSQNLAPGSYLTPAGFPSVSPVYGLNGKPSPAPPSRFTDPSPPFGLPGGPIGMGYPSQPKSRPPPIGSLDEFSPPHFGSRALSSAGAHELPTQLSSMSLGDSTSTAHSLSAFPPHSAAPGPIGPPKAAPTPIGRPSLHPDAPTLPHRNRSPIPDKVLGSAALGSDDDEIVQTGRRNTSNGWDIPSTAQGSRWSTAPISNNIWGASGLSGSGNHGSGIDLLHGNTSWNPNPPPHAGQAQQLRQGSFGGLGAGGFGGIGPNSGPFGTGLNLFSPPPSSTSNHNSLPHPHQHPPHH